MSKNTNIIIRINKDLKDDISLVCKENDISLSSLINAYLEDTAKKKKIPLNILSKINYHKIKERGILNIVDIKKSLDEIIQREGKGDIKKAYLFGSYARGEATKNSDVDIRLELGDKLSLFDLSNISSLLKAQLGKDIDLIAEDIDNLDPVFYSQIKKEEICLYEQKG